MSTSAMAPVAVPLTAAAVVDGAMATVLDSIVEVERLMGLAVGVSSGGDR